MGNHLLKLMGVPRIRGGVPTAIFLGGLFLLCSPHTRGCSYVRDTRIGYLAVFPAYAGVFL